MKYRFFLTILILGFSYSPHADANELTGYYYEHCLSRYSKSYCSCSLSAFSDGFRERHKKELPAKEMGFKDLTKNILADPVMTQGKLDAVCDLHDQALAQQWEAALANQAGDKEGYKHHTDKKIEMFNKKKELVQSYKPGAHAAGSLVSGNYCDNRNKLNQMKLDQADTGELYAELRRMLEVKHPYLPGQIVRMGAKAGCPQ